MSVVAIDLGPSLQARAEREGSNWLDRPMHIGRLGVAVGRGRFVIEDLRIDGLTPEARPWLVAKRIDISLTWGALLDREVLLRLDRDDRLADGGRELPERHAQLAAPERAAARAAHRPAPRRHDDAVRARDAR